MARLIEVSGAMDGSSHLSIRVGDVLLFRAAGGHVRDGVGVLDRLGPYRPAILLPDGGVISPEGPPTSILFLARQPGRAVIDLVSGDPWRDSRIVVLHVTVEA